MALWLVWMGKDSSGSPAVRAYKQDWKPLGISRSSDPPSVVCAPGGSKSQDFRCFHSHLFLMPDLPSSQQPCPRGALLQLLRHYPPYISP